MSARLSMPWFFPLAAAMAYACSGVALRIYRNDDRKGRKTWQAVLMLSLGWYPVLAWGIAQFMSETPR